MKLVKVDDNNLWDIIKLTVKNDQQEFVATNTVSILQAYTRVAAGQVALPFGLYDGDIPVGFVMIGYDLKDEENPPGAKDNYVIWRFMIDQKHQGQGFGKTGMVKTLEYIKSFPAGPAVSCWISYETKNAVAKKLYQSLGFVETGEMIGDEKVAVLIL